MKKKLILPSLIVALIITCTIFISDGLSYLFPFLMALAIIGIIRRKKTTVMKITRWAKINPRKTQVLITLLQLFLIAFGLIAGYNLKKLGYELSNTTAYVFTAIMVAGFLSIKFLPQKNTIAIPHIVNRNRMIYMCIALSSFVLTILAGNRIEESHPASAITKTLKAIDLVIFPEDGSLQADFDQEFSAPVYMNHPNQHLADRASMVQFASFTYYANETITPPTEIRNESKVKPKADRKANRLEKRKAKFMKKLEKYRLALTAAIGVGGVLLIILLIITTCAGICLIIGGFGGGGWGLVPLGAAIAGASIWGIIKVAQKKDKPIKSPGS